MDLGNHSRGTSKSTYRADINRQTGQAKVDATTTNATNQNLDGSLSFQVTNLKNDYTNSAELGARTGRSLSNEWVRQLDRLRKDGERRFRRLGHGRPERSGH